MQVAYVALAPFISGSERSLQNILLHCESVGINPILITPLGSPLADWAFENKITAYSCDLSAVDISNPFQWIKIRWHLWRIFKRHNIQVVHSNQLWSYPAVNQLARVLGVKRVCHFRDPVDTNGNWWLKGGLDLAVSISCYITSQLDKSIHKGLIQHTETLINPVFIRDSIDLEQDSVLGLAAKEKLGIKADIFTFGFIGQIAEVKGLDLLIESLSHLKCRNWQLIVAGHDPLEGQPYLSHCKALIEQYGLTEQVIFLGFIENTNTFYQAVDIVTMFSREEPLGRVPLEAGACYRPTIATRVGGLPETIRDGLTGWLVELENVEQQTFILNHVMSLELKEYGFRARDWVESIASPQIYIENLNTIYRQLLDRA